MKQKDPCPPSLYTRVCTWSHGHGEGISRRPTGMLTVVMWVGGEAASKKWPCSGIGLAKG